MRRASSRGLEVFIDSNIFTYHLSGHKIFGEPCRDFLRRVERKEYEGYVNDIIISEVLLNFLKSELFRLREIPPHKVVREIKRDPSLIELVDFDAVTMLFDGLDLNISFIGFGCVEVTMLMGKYNLLPNDALHLATMKRYGITNIATNDGDFERAPWLKIWKPR
jgi:predicted nucleic acid-binding protein